MKIGVAGLLIAIICLSPLTIEPATANSECSTDQQFYGSLTNLKGKREGIISNRHQEHFWITADGVFHALINNGKKQNALQLFSSINGIDWFLQITFSNTNHRSHPDGFLKDDILWIVYPSSDDEIFLYKLSYAFQTKSWWEKTNTIKVYQQAGYVPDRPTLAVDRWDQIWIAFSELDQKTNQTLIKVIKLDGNMGGLNCCEAVPATFSISTSSIKSARILALEDKIVLIYTDKINDGKKNEDYGYSLNWAYMPLPYLSNSEWITGGELLQYKSDENDPHGTHFNVAKDSFDNIHIVTRAEKRIIYLSIKNGNSIQIDQARSITTESSPPYMQISISENNEIYVIYPVRCMRHEKLNFNVKILKSYDLGETFQETAILELDHKNHPGNPRLEAPENFKKTLPILWQIRQQNSKYAMFFFEI